MLIRVKFNADVRYRRRAAFARAYRARSVKARFLLEMGLMLAFFGGFAGIWLSKTPIRWMTIVLYACFLLGALLLARLVRVLMSLKRIKPVDDFDAAREFRFVERGFRFGPIDRAGNLLETRWRDVDRAYLSRDAIFLLCMSRRNWAVVDPRNVLEGSRAELIRLLSENLPKEKKIGFPKT